MIVRSVVNTVTAKHLSVVLRLKLRFFRKFPSSDAIRHQDSPFGVCEDRTWAELPSPGFLSYVKRYKIVLEGSSP